jgi:DNA-binding SARP family transcriptional activator
MNAIYRLCLLGRFELLAPDGSIAMPASKGLAVLAYLACARDRQASRQALTDLLWQDSERESGRLSLRQALYAIRRALGADVVEGDGEWLTLSPRIATDADAFQEAARRGAMRDAVAGYTGEFIPAFAAPGASNFERWAESERLRLRSAFVVAARTEHQRLTGEGATAAALAIATRLRDADGDDDASWQLLFTSLALAGQFAHLELEAVAWRAARADEAPAAHAATEALLLRLRKHGRTAIERTAPGAPGQVPVHPEFQGRSTVFAAVMAAWTRARGGRSQALVLDAPAGFGKSRMLDEVARRLRVQKGSAIRTDAHQRERDDAYTVLADLVVQLAQRPGAAGIARASASVLAGIAPALAEVFNVEASAVTADAAELVRHRSLATADLLGAVADEEPFVLLLDDLQWADAASLQCLTRALTRIDDKAVLVVAASRTPMPHVGQPLRLPPLTAEEVGAIVASIAGVEPPGWTDAYTAQLTQQCGGSPFRVLQGLRSAIVSGAARIEAQQWQVQDPVQFAQLINPAVGARDRFVALPPLEGRTLAMLALVDHPLDVPVLAAALRHDPSQVVEALLRLDGEGFVVRSDAGLWSLAHALVADELAQVLDDALRQACAASLGRTLAGKATDVQQLRDAVRLLLDGSERAEALYVAERFVERLGTEARQGRDDEAFVAMLLGSQPDPALHRALHRRVTRRRHRRRATLVLGAIGVMGTLAIGLRWPSVASLVAQASARPPRASVAPMPTLVPAGLRAYFALDGDAANAIVPTDSGASTGVTWGADRRGTAARASMFDGAGYIDWPPTVLNDLPLGSLALWVRWSGEPGLQAITSKQRDNDNTWGVLSVSGSAGVGGAPTPGDAGRVYYHGSHERMSGATSVLASTTVLRPGRWYHVAVTWDSTRMQLFVNGRAEADGACVNCTIVPNIGSGIVSRLGDWMPDGRRHPFRGGLDEVRVYGRVLTAAEIGVLAGDEGME